jgi:hypothetical protein
MDLVIAHLNRPTPISATKEAAQEAPTVVIPSCYEVEYRPTSAGLTEASIAPFLSWRRIEA